MDRTSGYYIPVAISASKLETQAVDRNSVVSSFWLVEAAIILALGTFAYFFHLDWHHLLDWDEAIYAQISREILRGNSWLTLHWNFQPWFEKPPLFMWATALVMKFFGVSEATGRAASAAFGSVVLLLTYVYARTIGGRRLGWLAAIVLLTTPGFFIAARFGTTDVLLTLAAYLCVIGLHAVDRDRPHGWYLFWAALGMAAMTKGAACLPIVLTLPSLAIWHRWTWAKFGPDFYRGLALFAVIVAPWHIYMLLQYGREFFDKYLGYHVLARSLNALEGHVGGPRYYLNVIAERATPWVYFLPIAALGAIKDKRLHPALCLVVIELGFFSVIRTKLPWYIVPIYPGIALIVAAQLDLLITEWPRAGRLYPAALAAMVAMFFYLSFRELKTMPDNRRDLDLLVSARPDKALGPLTICTDTRDAFLPAYVYYADRPTDLAFLNHRAAVVDPGDPNWSPVSKLAEERPRLVLIDQATKQTMSDQFSFSELDRNEAYSLGLLSAHQR